MLTPYAANLNSGAMPRIDSSTDGSLNLSSYGDYIAMGRSERGAVLARLKL